MENKVKHNDFLDLLTEQELSEKLHNAISSLYTEEKVGGTLTMPSTYPKSLVDKICNIAVIEDHLRSSIMNRGEKDRYI